MESRIATLTSTTAVSYTHLKHEDTFDDAADEEITFEPYTADDFPTDVYMDEDRYKVLKSLLLTKKNVILDVHKRQKKSTFRQELNLASGTWTKLNKGEEVSLSILLRIWGYLNCDIGDICEAVRTDKD